MAAGRLQPLDHYHCATPPATLRCVTPCQPAAPPNRPTQARLHTYSDYSLACMHTCWLLMTQLQVPARLQQPKQRPRRCSGSWTGTVHGWARKGAAWRASSSRCTTACLMPNARPSGPSCGCTGVLCVQTCVHGWMVWWCVFVFGGGGRVLKLRCCFIACFIVCVWGGGRVFERSAPSGTSMWRLAVHANCVCRAAPQLHPNDPPTHPLHCAHPCPPAPDPAPDPALWPGPAARAAAGPAWPARGAGSSSPLTLTPEPPTPKPHAGPAWPTSSWHWC